MKKALSSNIIPSEALTEWSTWQVHELGSAKPSARPEAAAPSAPVPQPAEQGQTDADVSSTPSEVQEEAAGDVPLSYPTAAELEAIHQEAWQAGYEAGLNEGRSQGHKEGHEAGLAAVQNEFNTIWQPVEKVATAFSQEVSLFEKDLGEQLLKVAFSLAEKLAAAQIKLDRNTIRGVLAEAMAEWPDEVARARVRVNPADLAVVRALLETDVPQTVWQWVEDPAIERGGCIIDTKGVSLDLTLERRREALAAALGLISAADEAEPDNA